MRHFGWVFGFTGVLAILLALDVADAVAQKKKAEPKKNKNVADLATPADYKLIQNKKELVGSLVAVNGSTVTIKVDFPHVENNPKYKAPKVTNPKASGYNAQANQEYQLWRTYQDMKVQQQLAMNAKNPQERQRALQRYYQDMARFQQQQQQQYKKMMTQVNKTNKTATGGANDPFVVVHAYKEFEFEMEMKAAVKKMYLPFEFDDTGNPKKYTDKEKADLRGDDKSNPPRYMAKMDEATPGTEAKLFLTPPKKVEKPKEEDGVGNIERATINLLLLTKEGTMSAGEAPKRKKDKK
ncbi:MAG: hypothetical protein EXR98_16750 [Gemmataceae bacterium]|nr:hypothetical protein [Gemmataceae bacterium]